MKVLLIGRDFDFSYGDGISRYSFEIYEGYKRRMATTRKEFSFSTAPIARTPMVLRSIKKIKVRGVELAHLMYPNPGYLDNESATLVVTWHDNRVFTRMEGEKSLLRNQRAKAVKAISIDNYKKSNAIISVSSKTNTDLKSYLSNIGVYDDSKKYYVINSGIDDKFIKSKIWKGERKDFVYIGTIEKPHKNIPTLLLAFSQILKESDINAAKLHVFTPTEEPERVINGLLDQLKISNLRVEKEIIIHKKSSDEEVISTLSKALALMHLSKIEGFGSTVIESIALGTPAMVLDKADIPKETTKYAYSGSYLDIIKEGLRLLDSQETASKKAIDYARDFNWQTTIKKTLDVYREVCGKS